MHLPLYCLLGENMRIGIPEGLLFRRYETFIREFFGLIGADISYSGPSDRKTLEKGIRTCVDEACLPVKIFHGQVSRLQESCDYVAVLRLMKCEFGESICPKFAGLPELVGSGAGNKEKSGLAFTSPVYMNDKDRFKKAMVKDGVAIGISRKVLKSAFDQAYHKFFDMEKRDTVKEKIQSVVKDRGNVLSVGLLGHPYNTLDPFVNMDLIMKLKRMGVVVFSSEGLSREMTEDQFGGLIKKPYWRFFKDYYGAAGYLVDSKMIDGIVYVSSFCCGTDSFTIEMIRNRIGEFPMLVVKLDEHTGEAGINTRIEAFVDLLERRKQFENYIPKVW